jgi:hypothetical protein
LSCCVDLHNELFLFEEWIIEIEEQLRRFNLIRTDKILSEDFQCNLRQLAVRYLILMIWFIKFEEFRNYKRKLNQKIVVYRL